MNTDVLKESIRSAIGAEDLERLEEIVAAVGNDLSVIFPTDYDFLSSALYVGNAEIVRALLDLGAQLDVHDRAAGAPACMAALRGDVRIIRAVAAAGALFHNSHYTEGTPAELVALSGIADAIRTVAELGRSGL